jgi:hypothetical protein
MTETNATNHLAIQSKDASSLELTVTIRTHVLMTNVSMELVSTLLKFANVTILATFQAAIQLLEHVNSLQRTVMMEMHVPQILATSPLETVSTNQSSALMQTDVPLKDAMLSKDVSQLQRTVMTTTHVLLILVTQLLDASTLLKMLMTRTHVLEIGVMQTLEKLNTN